jgi:hypothetical protein
LPGGTSPWKPKALRPLLKLITFSSLSSPVRASVRSPTTADGGAITTAGPTVTLLDGSPEHSSARAVS